MNRRCGSSIARRSNGCKLLNVLVAEETADPNSYGFRTYRSAADAIQQAFILLSWKRSPQWILEGDIRSCFDTISHVWLMNNIPMDKAVLGQWLKAGYVDKKVLYPTERGTPQGGIASPTLANMVLDGLEGLLKECFPEGSLVHFVRYADDWIVTGRSQEQLEDEYGGPSCQDRFYDFCKHILEEVISSLRREVLVALSLRRCLV